MIYHTKLFEYATATINRLSMIGDVCWLCRVDLECVESFEDALQRIFE